MCISRPLYNYDRGNIFLVNVSGLWAWICALTSLVCMGCGLVCEKNPDSEEKWVVNVIEKHSHFLAQKILSLGNQFPSATNVAKMNVYAN